MTDDEVLLQTAHAVADAISRRDVAMLAGMLAAEFAHRADTGVVSDAAGFLEGIRSIPGEIVFVRLERVDADVSGDGAMLTGIQHAQVRVDGVTIDDRRAFADFFVRTGGRWKLRAAADFPV